MARYFLEVMYDGTAFHGSQLQGDTPTVQLALNNAIATLLRVPVITFGASRTDEGVHALCNFYHFDMEIPLPPNFIYRINALMPPMLAIRRMYKAADNNFNARFDAINRSYRYRVYGKKDPFLAGRALYFPYKINEDTLHATAAVLMEYDNFESFSKRNTQTFTFLCKIYESRWERHGEELHYVVTANRFLRGMVRGLVGTQLKIARGNGTADDMRSILEAKDCTLADFSVTGNGLYLEQIEYPEGALVEVKDSM